MSHNQCESVVFLVTRVKFWVWGKTVTRQSAVFITF